MSSVSSSQPSIASLIDGRVSAEVGISVSTDRDININITINGDGVNGDGVNGDRVNDNGFDDNGCDLNDDGLEARIVSWLG